MRTPAPCSGATDLAGVYRLLKFCACWLSASWASSPRPGTDHPVQYRLMPCTRVASGVARMNIRPMLAVLAALLPLPSTAAPSPAQPRHSRS
jgi:hypothetical protein